MINFYKHCIANIYLLYIRFFTFVQPGFEPPENQVVRPLTSGPASDTSPLSMVLFPRPPTATPHASRNRRSER